MSLLTPSSPAVAWTLIVVSGLLEIAFAMSINYSNGFTRLLPYILTFVFGGLSVYLMSLSLAVIPISLRQIEELFLATSLVANVRNKSVAVGARVAE